MMFNGFPLVFFIRDTLHIGPATNVFTAFFFALALLLMFPTHLFVRLYKPNATLMKYGVLFLAIVLYHFFLFNNSGFDWFVEIGNLAFTFAFLFLLIHVPNDVKDTLVPIIFLFAFFSNLTLIYSLLTDPNWKLGMRAAVTFENAGAQEGGNPHIAARNGLICMLSGAVLAWKYNNILVKLFLIVSVIFSLAVIILAQVKSSMLAIGLMVCFFFFFNARFSNVVSIAKSIFRVRNIVILVILIVGLNVFLSRYGDLYGMIYGYWLGFQTKIMDVIFTASGIKVSDTVGVDASAMGRVSSITYFINAFGNPTLLIIGGGYKHIFMDVPILESMINHGIFGFFFFAGFNYYLFVYTIKELRKPTNPLTLFLAYFFIYFLVLLISNGRPYDVSFWFPYALMIRFLGIKYLDSIQESASKPVAELAT
jgi:hypothetical protein